MKFVYVYVDEDDDVIGVYENVDDALNQLLDDNYERYVFVSEEKLKAIFAEAHEAISKEGDTSWANVAWLDDDDEIKGVIYQRPLVKSKKKRA